MKKHFLSFAIILFFMFMLTGCKKQTIDYSQTGFYFDTAIQITVYGTSDQEDSLQKALNDAFLLCETYENMLSRTRMDSDVYRINHANGEWVMVSDETIRVLYTALNYCDLSDGHIDITVAGVKDLWDFSSSEHVGSLPDKYAIAEELLYVDYSQVQIDGNKVRLTSPSAQIDLGFIAKGFIADEIKASLIQNDVASALIDLGGNILVLGEKPDHTAFKIGIQKPFADSAQTIATIDVSDASGINTVVTSGIYERYFEYDNTIYHHILDAKTGYPVQNNLFSVTILTNNSMNADALSTTCLAMGLEWSMDFLSTLDGVDAIFVTDTLEIIDTRAATETK